MSKKNYSFSPKITSSFSWFSSNVKNPFSGNKSSSSSSSSTSSTPEKEKKEKSNAIQASLGIEITKKVIEIIAKFLPFTEPVCHPVLALIGVAEAVSKLGKETDKEILMLLSKIDAIKSAVNELRKVQFYINYTKKYKDQYELQSTVTLNENHMINMERVVGELTSFLSVYIPKTAATGVGSTEQKSTLRGICRFFKKLGFGLSVEKAKPLIAERMNDLMNIIFAIKSDADTDLDVLYATNDKFHKSMLLEAVKYLKNNPLGTFEYDDVMTALNDVEPLSTALQVVEVVNNAATSSTTASVEDLNTLNELSEQQVSDESAQDAAQILADDDDDDNNQLNSVRSHDESEESLTEGGRWRRRRKRRRRMRYYSKKNKKHFIREKKNKSKKTNRTKKYFKI